MYLEFIRDICVQIDGCYQGKRHAAGSNAQEGGTCRRYGSCAEANISGHLWGRELSYV